MTLDRAARLALVGLNLFLGASALLGAVAVVPALPPGWLAGTPFPDYTVPALALGAVGAGALLHRRGAPAPRGMGRPAVPRGRLRRIAAFELVETLVVGLDVWLHALGLTAAPGKGLPGTSLEGVPAPLGVPLPLWLQPAYFALGLVIVALAVRLRAHHGHRARSRPGPRLAAGRSGSGSGGPATPAARARPSALAGLALRPVPALLVFAGLWAVFLLVLHPWMMGWGATPEERAMALPGDAGRARGVLHPRHHHRRPAPPSGRGCWPIGQDRAGFHSNDWLENLFGGDIHNADALRARVAAAGRRRPGAHGRRRAPAPRAASTRC